VTTETKQETAVEDIKRSSNYLRGAISQELDNDVASVPTNPSRSSSSTASTPRTIATCAESAPSRVKSRLHLHDPRRSPRRRLTTDQWLALDAAPPTSRRHIRLTTRQAVQFHGC